MCYISAIHSVIFFASAVRNDMLDAFKQLKNAQKTIGPTAFEINTLYRLFKNAKIPVKFHEHLFLLPPVSVICIRYVNKTQLIVWKTRQHLFIAVINFF